MGAQDNQLSDGDRVAGPDGSIYTYKGGQLFAADGSVHNPTSGPSATEDVKQAVPAGLARGAIGFETTPGTLASTAVGAGGWLANQAAQHIPGTSQEQADTWSKGIQGGTQKAQDFLYPGTYDAAVKDVAKSYPGVNYQAQTEPGRVAQSVSEFIAGGVPMAMMTGGESLVPAIGKNVAAGLGSEAAGYLSNDNPYARMVGALVGYGGMPSGAKAPTTPRGAMAETLDQAGVPVSAAQRTGSRLRATLEGPAGDNSSAVSDALFQQGGVTRQPGNLAPISDLVAQRGRALGQQFNALESNTSLPPANANAVWPDLGNIDLSHSASGTGLSGNASTLVRPEVHQAYEDFANLAQGGQGISGRQYRDLSQKWNGSDIPEVRQMGQRLDREMETIHPEWSQVNEDWANFKGLQAGVDKAGGAATQNGIDPSTVRSGMWRDTPMRRTAEAGEGINKSNPEPYSTAPLDNTAALAGLLYGGAHGGLTGAGEGFLPGALGGVSKALELGQPFFRSRLGQHYLMVDPKEAAAALYGGSNQPEGQVQK